MSAGEIPWGSIITAVVGISGIAGSVLTAHLTNRAAERRLGIEHAHADRTRFHPLRVELYGKLFAAAQDLRLAILEALPRMNELNAADVGTFIDSFNTSIAAVISSAQMVALVASGRTRDAASSLVESLLSLSTSGWRSRADFQSFSRLLDEAILKFSDAARAELLPPGQA